MAGDKTYTVIDESSQYSMEELCELCRIHDDLVHEMINEGLLTPSGDSPKNWIFGGDSIQKAQVAIRLKNDLGVNIPGAALAIELMAQLRELKD